MADDDDQEFSLRTGREEGSTTTQEEEAAPPPESQAAAPESSEAGAPEDPALSAQRKANIERLEHNYQQISSRENEMLSQVGKEIQALTQLVNKPLPELHLQAPPPPPNEKQKGDASEFVINLLKFGALMTVAFGTGGRHFGHNAIWKAGIGAALQGWTAGRKDVVERSMQLWEKNRQAINDANKEQTELYKANMSDSRLSLQQRIDLNNQVATAYRDYRMMEATKNSNLTEINAAISAQERVHKDSVNWQRREWDKIYNIMGKPEQTARYWAWVREQSGGKVNITRTSSIEELEKAEKEYPPYKFLKHQEEEELKKFRQKQYIGAKARAQGKAEGEKAVPQSGTSDLDAAAKSYVDEMFGGGGGTQSSD